MQIDNQDIKQFTEALEHFGKPLPSTVRDVQAQAEALGHVTFTVVPELPEKLTAKNVTKAIRDRAAIITQNKAEHDLTQALRRNINAQLPKVWGAVETMWELFDTFKPVWDATAAELTELIHQVPAGVEGLTADAAVEGGYGDTYQRILELEEDIRLLGTIHSDIVRPLFATPNEPHDVYDNLTKRRHLIRPTKVMPYNERPHLERGAMVENIGEEFRHWPSIIAASDGLELAWMTPLEMHINQERMKGHENPDTESIRFFKERDGHRIATKAA